MEVISTPKFGARGQFRNHPSQTGSTAGRFLATDFPYMDGLDLSAYFQRIGYAGSTAPTLDTLRDLHWAHVSTFVFENLTCWSNRLVSLKLEDIVAKMIAGRRGGYCFETNALFAAVLRKLGYRVGLLAARVRWMQAPGGTTPRTHMLLRVEVDGRDWIADVGFGAIGQTVPLALDTAAVQVTPHEARRFVREGDIVIHQVQLAPGEWADVNAVPLSGQEGDVSGIFAWSWGVKSLLTI
jgi:N-hydroxyarylamine O-acetyltransferase